MELLTNTVPEVRFNYPDPETTGISATYSLNSAPPVNLIVNTNDEDQYATAKLPYQAADGMVHVVWSFTIPGIGNYSRTDYYDVITPILTNEQVREIIGSDATSQEVFDAEASARYIIQSYTGQTFGKYVGTLNVSGGGENWIRLPKRLIKLNSINSNTIVNNWVNVRGGGWFIESKVIGVPSIRADLDGWHQVPDSGVITAPPRWAKALLPFQFGFEYAIDGEWGWNSVPARVVDAAKLLVNDYACGDSIYRDRFISSISGPDWQLRFNQGAYTSTGNVRADQLLADYKLRRGWQVI